MRPQTARERISIGSEPAPDDLAGYLDFAWWVHWHTGADPHVQRVIPRPVVHLAAERIAGQPRLFVHGVCSDRFERRLDGVGSTVALAFRPAGFRPMLGSSVAALRDRQVPAEDLFDVDGAALAERALDEGGAGHRHLVDWLRERVPSSQDPVALELADMVEQIESDQDLTRVEQVAAAAGVGIRTLQRRFEEYVGISPKWVLRRCRLLDVAAAVHTGEPVDWSALAAQLGYADQSHLVREFRAVVGESPESYRRTAT